MNCCTGGALNSREGVKRTLLEDIRCDYDKHRIQSERFGETGSREDEEELDFDALLEKNLL